MPLAKVVAVVRRGGQGDGGAVIDCGLVCTDGTVLNGCQGDGVGGQLGEVGRVGAGSSDREGVARFGRNHAAVEGPVGEAVAAVGRSRNGAFVVLVVSACTAYGTTIAGAGYHADGVAVAAEVSHESSCLGDGEAVSGVGGNGRAILGPVDKGVAAIGCGGQSGGAAFFVSVAASDGTTCCRIGTDSDGIVSAVAFGDFTIEGDVL